MGAFIVPVSFQFPKVDNVRVSFRSENWSKDFES